MFLHLLSIGVAEVSAAVTFGKWRTLNRLLILQSHVLRCVKQNVCNVFLCNFQNSFHSVYNGCERFPNVLSGESVRKRYEKYLKGFGSGFQNSPMHFARALGTFRNSYFEKDGKKVTSTVLPAFLLTFTAWSLARLGSFVSRFLGP